MHRFMTPNIKSNEPTSSPNVASPLPNDLWRFFEGSGETSGHKSFVEELLRTDRSASSRVKEVMGVMELYETATASWGDPQSHASSRKWFQPPETSFEIDECPERTSSEVWYLRKSEFKSDAQQLDWIPSWRVMSAAVYLSTASKQALMERCTPKLSRTSGDHMSLMHTPDAMALLNLPLGKTVKLMAYGEKCGLVAQQVALKPPSELMIKKSHPHVTVSFAERVLKRDIAAMKGNGSFDRWVFPLELEGVVGIKMDNGNILFSDEEFYIETGVDLKEIRKQLETDKAGSEKEQKDEEGTDAASLEETPSEARPSEEIRRLMAQDSFSKPDGACAQLSPPSPRIHPEAMLDAEPTTSRRLEKTTSLTETRGMIKLPEDKPEDKSGLKILRVSRNNRSLFDRHTLSPSRRSNADHMQQEFKAKQAKLRAECEDHRQASRAEQRKGEEYLEMARAAYREGQREKADSFNRASQEATLKHKEHTSKAERLAFEASNLGRINTHTVDLHLLHLQEAIALLKKVINGLSSFVDDVGSIYRLRIITGKGINSLDNQPVLRPAVLEYLKSNGLDAEVDEYNEGVVTAYINPTL